MFVYSEEFYAGQSGGSVRSARQIVPYVVSLVEPRSVVDVGCGVGTWLSVFREQGVETLLGIDGDYVPREKLYIPADRFLPRDLTKPVGVSERFDLAVSLEVAEHLPPEAAEGFVDQLAGLADIVLFSAAVPGQGGANHINERWQSYWRGLFERRGYSPVDCLRGRYWSDPAILSCYRQNIVIYARKEALEAHPALRAEAERPPGTPFDVVHPEIFAFALAIRDHYRLSLGTLARRLPGAMADSVRWRLGLRGSA